MLKALRDEIEVFLALIRVAFFAGHLSCVYKSPAHLNGFAIFTQIMFYIGFFWRDDGPYWFIELVLAQILQVFLDTWLSVSLTSGIPAPECLEVQGLLPYSGVLSRVSSSEELVVGGKFARRVMNCVIDFTSRWRSALKYTVPGSRKSFILSTIS